MIAGLTVLAAVLGSYDLTAKSLWLDEVVSSNHVTSGVLSLGGAITGGDPNMGLYYALLFGWVKLFGDGEVALRSLSLLLGALSVPAIAILGRRLFGRTAGLLAGLLLAVNPFLIHYEQTARAYSLVVLLVTLSSYFFLRELQAPSPVARYGYVLSSAGSVYAHYFAAYVLVAQLLALVATGGCQALTPARRRSALAVVILCCPEVVFAARRGVGGISWISRPHLASVPDLFTQLAGSSELAWLLGGLAIVGAVTSIRTADRWRGGFVVVWLLLPVAATYAISQLGRPIWISYYLIVVLPAFLLLAARGLASFRFGAVAPLLAFLVLAGPALSSWYDGPSFYGYRGATRFLLAHERRGDRIVYDRDYAKDGFAYYAARAHRSLPAPSPLTDLRLRPVSAFRLWIVMRGNDVGPAQTARLEGELRAQRGAPLARAEFPNLLVILYAPVRRATGSAALRPGRRVTRGARAGMRLRGRSRTRRGRSPRASTRAG